MSTKLSLLVITLVVSIMPTSSVLANTTQIMEATWYGPGMDCYQTKNGCEFLYADGDTFDMNDQNVVATHEVIPLGTRLRITYPETGVSIIVTVKDRLARHSSADLDLTKGTAEQIGMIQDGRVDLVVEFLD